MENRTKIWGIVIILLFVILRLIIFWITQPWDPEVEKNIILERDPWEYHHLAVTLIENHRFAYSDISAPDSRRTPLFPMFISLNYCLFGEKPWAAILGQIFINVLSCIILLYTFFRMFGSRIALVASGCYALDPNNILHSALLYSEIFFMFFLALALFIISYAVTSSSPRKTLYWYVMLGICMGMATLVRPLAQYVPLVVIVFLIVLYRHKISQGIMYSIVFLALFTFTISPWVYRYYVNFGHLSLSSIDWEVLFYDMVYIEKAKSNQDFHTVRDRLALEADRLVLADGKQLDRSNVFQQLDYRKQLAIEYIKDDPISFTRHYISGLFKSLFSLGRSHSGKMLHCPGRMLGEISNLSFKELLSTFLKNKGLCKILILGTGLIYLLIFYVSLVIGLVVARKNRWTAFLTFGLLMFIYLTMIGGLSAAIIDKPMPRFRLPPSIFVLPLVGIGLIHIYERLKVKRLLGRG